MNDTTMIFLGGIAVFYFVFFWFPRSILRANKNIAKGLGIDKRIVHKMTSRIVKHHKQTFYRHLTLDFAAKLVFINEMITDPNLSKMGIIAMEFRHRGFDPVYNDMELNQAFEYLVSSDINNPLDYEGLRKCYFQMIENDEYLSAKKHQVASR